MSLASANELRDQFDNARPFLFHRCEPRVETDRGLRLARHLVEHAFGPPEVPP